MTNGGQRPDPLGFRIENEMDLLFGRAHPNPTRVGCPPPELLKRLARRELPIDDPAYDHFAKCSPCYQELRALQVADGSVQLVLGGLGNRLEQYKRDVLPDHRRRLENCLVPGRQPVDAGGQHRLYRGGDLDRWERPLQPVGTALTFQGAFGGQDLLGEMARGVGVRGT